jgi:hypothetical protein
MVVVVLTGVLLTTVFGFFAELISVLIVAICALVAVTFYLYSFIVCLYASV